MDPDPHAGTKLLEAARRGDRHARDRLVEEHLPIVRAITLRYRDLGVPLDDLVQEGALGLLEAIERFDPQRSDDFEAFARFRVRRAIRNALTEQSRLIRLPKQVVERRRAIEATEARLIAASGHGPTPDEIAEATGLSPAAITASRDVGKQPVSLDQAVLEDGSPLESHIVDGAALDPAAEAADRQLTRAVDDAVNRLPPRQREVVTRHFGVGCPPEEISEVAHSLHVSQQRTRAIERDALYTLRDGLERLVTPRADG